MWLPTTSDLIIIYFRTTIRVKDFTQIISIIEFIWAPSPIAMNKVLLLPIFSS